MKQLKRLFITTFCLISTLGLSQTEQPMIGEKAPAYTLDDTRGGNISSADLLGKFVVIHFAASW